MAKISIIIPVYNVENYIARCLDSVLGQSFADFEVICIDDGSTDSSGKILDDYAEKDKRIKPFHISNKGVSNARNYGLDMMTGEWFAFVDADDWIEEDYLKILYDNAFKNNCSVSACSFQRNFQYTVGVDKVNIVTELINSQKECIHNFICSKNSMQGMVWNKLYLADKHKDVRFDVRLKVNEDCLYTYEIMKNCQRAYYCSMQLYHWFFRKESACHTRIIKKDFSAANVFLDIYNKTQSMNDAEVDKALKSNYVKAVVKMLLFARYKVSEQDVIEAKKQCKKWKKDIWEGFGKKEKVKYVLAVYLPPFLRLWLYKK